MPQNGISINLRVTCDRTQGDRKYMEDEIQIKFWRGSDGETIEFAFFAVFDGHGGAEAAKFAKQHLLDELVKQNGFWTEDDEQIIKAIREAFITTHKLMWKVVGTWPKTSSGFPSTAGTTASIAIIKGTKLFVAHVGDSSVVLGTQEEDTDAFRAKPITVDHKPESPLERERIEASGGLVLAKAGVQRVVWNRPKVTHEGPVRRSTHIDQIPFLAVARSLGDLWSYNFQQDTFVVSPEPDISVHAVHPAGHHLLVLASDGLWNMISPQEAINIAASVDECNPTPMGPRPASVLMRSAINRWAYRGMRADNTSVIVVVMEPPSAGRGGQLLRQESCSSVDTVQLETSPPPSHNTSTRPPSHPNHLHPITKPCKVFSPKRKTPCPKASFVRRNSEIAPSPSIEVVVETSKSPLPCKPPLVRFPTKLAHPLQQADKANHSLPQADRVHHSLQQTDVSAQYPCSQPNSRHPSLTAIKSRQPPCSADSLVRSSSLAKGKAPWRMGCPVNSGSSEEMGPTPAKMRRLCPKPAAKQSPNPPVLRMENGSKTNITVPVASSTWKAEVPKMDQVENVLQPCITRARAAQLNCPRVTRRRSTGIHNENCATKPKSAGGIPSKMRKAFKRKLTLGDSILPFRIKRTKVDGFRKVKRNVRRRSATSRR